MILCDYCGDEIAEPIHPNAVVNLFPRIDPDNPDAFQPTMETLDFHTECVDPWKTGAKNVKGNRPTGGTP